MSAREAVQFVDEDPEEESFVRFPVSTYRTKNMTDAKKVRNCLLWFCEPANRYPLMKDPDNLTPDEIDVLWGDLLEAAELHKVSLDDFPIAQEVKVRLAEDSVPDEPLPDDEDDEDAIVDEED